MFIYTFTNSQHVCVFLSLHAAYISYTSVGDENDSVEMNGMWI